jgi:hypothetical protein
MNFRDRLKGQYANLTADELNAMLDVAAAFARGALRPQRSGAGTAADDFFTPASVVSIENTTGSTLPSLAVLTSSGAAVDPDTDDASELASRRRPVLSASAPVTDTDPVLITFDSIPNGGIGRACIAGATVARVDVTDITHRYARPVVGSIFQLESAESGPVRLLTPPAETGVVRTYVLLTGATPTPAASGWVAGLTEDDCPRITVASASGACSGIDTDQDIHLAWDADEEAWVSPDDDGFTHDGGTDEVMFWLEGNDYSLSIGDRYGVRIDGDGDNLLFAFGGSPLCDGTPGDCNNTFVVAVACDCCPIEGYDGEGWYCVREAESDDPCAAVELLDVDKCDDAIEICSGPYASEAVATAACTPGLDCCDEDEGVIPLDMTITGSGTGGTVSWQIPGVTPGETYTIFLCAETQVDIPRLDVDSMTALGECGSSIGLIGPVFASEVCDCAEGLEPACCWTFVVTEGHTALCIQLRVEDGLPYAFRVVEGDSC